MRILLFTQHFYPGYKAGGVLKAVVNLVGTLNNEIEFKIVTSDRDLGDTEAYLNIIKNQWLSIGNAKVMYVKAKLKNLFEFTSILKNVPHDVLYLNGFFNFNFTVLPLIIRRLGFYKNKPIVLEPHGNFSPGAMKIKAKKKRYFIKIVKALRLYHGIVWQATSELEASEIRSVMGDVAKKILVAPYLLSNPDINFGEQLPQKKFTRQSGSLRLIFLSRISPKKNLSTLLEILKKVEAAVTLTIYGPIEDHNYWNKCNLIIKKLPKNIKVNYNGGITSNLVPHTFVEHDLFVFPTLGENFGHVIYEALSVGTAVIVSDQTPWKQDKEGAIEVISLEKIDDWVAIIEKWASSSDEELIDYRRIVYSYIKKYDQANDSAEKNRNLFKFAMEINNKF